MKKKICAAFLALALLISGFAWAEELTPMELIFQRGKEAVMLMAMGKVDEAMELIDFVFDVESEQTEESFRELVNAGFAMFDADMVQAEVALLWKDESEVWHLGIPLVEPVSWDIEALVLDTRDLMVFCSYSVSNWGALEEAAAVSEEAYWNIEYEPGIPVLFADE